MTDYISREAVNALIKAECSPKVAAYLIDAVATIPAADVRPLKWIPVAERLPRNRQFVLVYCGDNKRIRPSDRFDVAILLGDSIFTSLGVTHWMPLPEPPKEELA